MKFLILFPLTFLFICSCSSDDNTDSLLLPSNLTVSVVSNENGTILMQAAADDANFFQFDFGEGNGFITDDDGSISYEYIEEGDYTITIRANTTVNDYIETTESVTITIDFEISDDGYSTPMSYSGYTRVWNDEFNGTSLTSDWTHEIGTGNNGWGNNELQYYREENAIVGDGYLIISAKEEPFNGSEYTSSRIITEGHQSFRYGRIDIRAILPEGQGLWPALWMLGSNFRSIGWPFCGEIDIMEMVGGVGRENNVFGTLHWDNNGNYTCTCGEDHDYTLPSGTFNDEFHVFSIIWDANSITWYVDDIEYTSKQFSSDMEEFNLDFFFIFNVAVGGNLPGSPNQTTVFPQQMIVDYVRVFQPN